MTEHADDFYGAVSALEGVPSALAAARDGVDVLLRDRGLRRTTPALTTESLLRGAAASAQLAGSRSTLEDVRAGDGDVVARSAVRLYAELLSLVPVVGRSPLEALARMHTLAAAGTVPREELGRPRPGPEAAAMLRQLGQRLTSPTTAPAIAVAGLAHAELATAAPFATSNDLLARALERLLLVSRGVDPASVTVPEAGHQLLGEGYRRALAGYASASAPGRRAWLLHVASAATGGAAASPLRGRASDGPTRAAP